MSSSGWSFNLRTYNRHPESSDSDSSPPHSPSVANPPLSEEAKILLDLDISTREDTAVFKRNPWSIAKVNAASRPAPSADLQSKPTSKPSDKQRKPPQGRIADLLRKQAQAPSAPDGKGLKPGLPTRPAKESRRPSASGNTNKPNPSRDSQAVRPSRATQHVSSPQISVETPSRPANADIILPISTRQSGSSEISKPGSEQHIRGLNDTSVDDLSAIQAHTPPTQAHIPSSAAIRTAHRPTLAHTSRFRSQVPARAQERCSPSFRDDDLRNSGILNRNDTDSTQSNTPHSLGTTELRHQSSVRKPPRPALFHESPAAFQVLSAPHKGPDTNSDHDRLYAGSGLVLPGATDDLLEAPSPTEAYTGGAFYSSPPFVPSARARFLPQHSAAPRSMRPELAHEAGPSDRSSRLRANANRSPPPGFQTFKSFSSPPVPGPGADGTNNRPPYVHRRPAARRPAPTGLPRGRVPSLCAIPDH
ncbi:hypothetical protein BV25DRAFT_126476 [Artomyces pyxidatus]|uniref:Uncharacterized protein n=1 Tax=Artomyces pyxidatus TaxID=48021 RepID=A0ACB8T8Z5_9AGAM|nr:hypothetical protein BV25DRAFT_126476 [Artomyces pyxidatus]